ncbi:helix-turn-helix domain-containing protein [Azospirillum agricola]|uniref:helix-turn-helix domain-containing protein n=1 Tax=Azospirillum agricola TaxID=1720247 RepID=UPI000A0F21B2|nr:Helix-turn-helix [Azospirillum lipoferum]
MSQTDLGRALGVSFQQVQKYENGTTRVSASVLYRLANSLGVSVSYFFDGLSKKSQRASSPDGDDILVCREHIKLLQNYGALPDNLRKGIFAFLSFLNKSKDDDGE